MYLKYCGFTREEDIEHAIQCDIQAIGFITYPKSKRYVDLSRLAQLSRSIPETIDVVAVTVNASMDELSALVEQTAINTLQFHGDESPEQLMAFQQRYPEIQIFKALPAGPLLNAHIQIYQPIVDRILIDTPSSNWGGTGETFDWQQLHALTTRDYLVAGGFNIDNIQDFLDAYPNVAGMDIASGIEKETGIKDKVKMTKIATILKGE
ncbi:phosphoribosylanthranilate isomerase [Staphylococcus lutrae]|uniref:N-(5'-phosphoribosyl)anthranilate isomerase n=1 Tax=Staphylococcus lutrae TaxID=155085 RepID=A0AAC9RRV4_9STAP|nr:phosphoribosylanthranilate isomerase [Staphylococcus lutrae]ARJ50591.1 phosphoribosylanthranilate isomerase [Staphylococcus lutrae]PNZ37519.1 phosphoribosylanthranilate isomerase [Staphylococcus lutrae]